MGKDLILRPVGMGSELTAYLSSRILNKKLNEKGDLKSVKLQSRGRPKHTLVMEEDSQPQKTQDPTLKVISPP